MAEKKKTRPTQSNIVHGIRELEPCSRRAWNFPSLFCITLSETRLIRINTICHSSLFHTHLLLLGFVHSSFYYWFLIDFTFSFFLCPSFRIDYQSDYPLTPLPPTHFSSSNHTSDQIIIAPPNRYTITQMMTVFIPLILCKSKTQTFSPITAVRIDFFYKYISSDRNEKFRCSNRCRLTLESGYYSLKTVNGLALYPYRDHGADLEKLMFKNTCSIYNISIKYRINTYYIIHSYVTTISKRFSSRRTVPPPIVRFFPKIICDNGHQGVGLGR